MQSGELGRLSGAPPRPGPLEERAALLLLRALAPRIGAVELDDPPALLAPYERVEIALPNTGRKPARLSGTWFPAPEPARGAVLMLHPWLPWGQTYFYRRGRLPALRAAGLHALAIDLPGFGGSDPPRSLYDRAVAAALLALRQRAAGLPCHVWGVSSGGYWAHPVLSRPSTLEGRVGAANPSRLGLGVIGAMFEDVTPHLLEWSSHTAPRGKPAYTFFRTFLRRAHPYLDLRRHAPHLAAERVAYAGGATDHGIPVDDLRELASRARARCLVIEDAGHLQGIKRAGDEIVALALETFLA